MEDNIALWTKKWAESYPYPFLFFQQTTSTNDKAKEQVFSDKSPPHRLFIAESQTKGRGQGHKTWCQSDMMLSWSWTLKKAPQPKTTKLMGIALHSALKCVWPSVDFNIKKPNDIYVNGKKMAGLLVEVVNQGPLHELIIGAGMNVLTHPLSGPWTHLAAYIQKANMTQRHWFLFLNEWLKQIEQVIPHCTVISDEL